MAKIKLPSFDGGTLLQRTALYFATFVAGSIGFVAIASLLVVSAAKAIMPARGGASSDSSASEKAAELAAATPLKATGKLSRPKKVQPIAPDEAPAEATH